MRLEALHLIFPWRRINRSGGCFDFLNFRNLDFSPSVDLLGMPVESLGLFPKNKPDIVVAGLCDLLILVKELSLVA